VKPDILHAH